LGHSTTTARLAAPRASAAGFSVCACSASVAICAKKSAGIFGVSSPKRSFSCDSAISTAMPLVKPMMIGTGT
jgi:hypothetical protein